MANRVRTTVATRKPAGVPRPLPYATEIGTLPVMAVIGAALAVAMKSTANSPTAPTLSLLVFSALGTGAFSNCSISRLATCEPLFGLNDGGDTGREGYDLGHRNGGIVALTSHVFKENGRVSPERS